MITEKILNLRTNMVSNTYLRATKYTEKGYIHKDSNNTMRNNNEKHKINCR